MLPICSILHLYTHPLARSINKREKNAFSVWQRFDKWLENVKPDETARAIICFFLPSISSVNKRRGRLWCFHRALPDISSNSSWHTRSVSEFRGFARMIKRSNTFRNQLTWKILFRTTWAENAGSCWKSNPIPWLVSPPTPCFNTQYSIEMSSKPNTEVNLYVTSSHVCHYIINSMMFVLHYNSLHDIGHHCVSRLNSL